MLKIELQDRVIMLDEHLLRSIQANWRGKLLRRQMLKVQQEYLRLVSAIEQGPPSNIVWTASPVGYPIFAHKPVISKESLKTTQGMPKTIHDIPVHTGYAQKNHPLPNTSHSFDGYGSVVLASRSEKHAGIENVTPGVMNVPPQTIDGDIASQQIAESINCKHNTTKEQTITNTSEHEVKETRSDKSEHNIKQRLQPSDYETNKPSRGGKNNENNSENVLEKESSTNWNETSSLWNSFEASTISSPKKQEKENQLSLKDLNQDELKIARSHISMELLWIQQAINSRKQYLQIKSQIGVQ